jgi:hypothetical protein
MCERVEDVPSHRVTMRTLWAVAAFSFGAKMWSISGRMLRHQRQGRHESNYGYTPSAVVAAKTSVDHVQLAKAGF